MNETITSILERRSIRKYKSDPVPAELLDTLVECGKFAATARGVQPWHFAVVTNTELLDRIAKANKDFILSLPDGAMTAMAKNPDFHNFYHAPAAIIISGETSESAQEYVIADCANAAQNICVAAHSLGLGTCYIASFKFCLSSPLGDFMYDALKLPKGYRPMFAVAVGYPDEEPQGRMPRREGIVSYID